MLYRCNFLILGLAISLLPTAGFAGNAKNGGAPYQDKCAACHGKNGVGMLPGTPNFAKGERLEKSDSALKTSILNGINAMPPFMGTLTDGQVADILAYIRAFRK